IVPEDAGDEALGLAAGSAWAGGAALATLAAPGRGPAETEHEQAVGHVTVLPNAGIHLRHRSLGHCGKTRLTATRFRGLDSPRNFQEKSHDLPRHSRRHRGHP